MAKRESLDVIRNVVRAENAAKRPSPRKDGSGRVPSYLVRRLSTYFFQIRPPASLAPCGASCPPIRVRLGVLPKRDARRRAAWLGTLAQSAFEHWRRGVEGLEYGEFPHSDVGFPKGDSPEEFLANMMTFLKEAAARLENPAPPPVFSPTVMRDLAAIQESVVIEQEVRKGDAGHPTVTSRADLLRQDVWDRWRAGQGIVPIHAPIGKLAEVADRQLAILERTNSDSTIQQKYSSRPADRQTPNVSSNALQTAVAATIETSTAPLFSQLENDYVDIRKKAGASDATISTICGSTHSRFWWAIDRSIAMRR